jgi:hypothetical protein
MKAGPILWPMLVPKQVQRFNSFRSNRHFAHRHIVLIFMDLFFGDFVKQITKSLKNGP